MLALCADAVVWTGVLKNDGSRRQDQLVFVQHDRLVYAHHYLLVFIRHDKLVMVRRKGLLFREGAGLTWQRPMKNSPRR
jgi:hypothetical protein